MQRDQYRSTDRPAFSVPGDLLDYNPFEDAGITLRIILIEVGAAGMSSYGIASELNRRQPEIVSPLTNQLLRDWVRRQLNRMKDRDGAAHHAKEQFL